MSLNYKSERKKEIYNITTWPTVHLCSWQSKALDKMLLHLHCEILCFSSFCQSQRELLFHNMWAHCRIEMTVQRILTILTWVCDQVSEFQSFLASCTHRCLLDKVVSTHLTAGPVIPPVYSLQRKYKQSRVGRSENQRHKRSVYNTGCLPSTETLLGNK